MVRHLEKILKRAVKYQREVKQEHRRCDTGLDPVGLLVPLAHHVQALGLQKHPLVIADNVNKPCPTAEQASLMGLHTGCLMDR
jgi:hypothetical protein